MKSLNQELKRLCESSEKISEAEIICDSPHELHEEWDNFTRGKTCPVLDNGEYGVYNWDLKQFLSEI